MQQHLSEKEQVETQIAGLDDAVWQMHSDNEMFSKLLLEMSEVAKLRDVRQGSTRYRQVENYSSFNVYPVELAVSGTIMQVLQFVTDLLNRPTITGLKSFMIRGTQSGSIVECNLSIWMVGLVPAPSPLSRELG